VKTLIAAAAFAVGSVMPVLAADLVVATAGPMSGPYKAFGIQMKAGTRQAIADINAAGGINGRRINLVVEDDACDAKRATAVAEKLASAGAALVVGHFCSAASLSAAAVYARTGIIQISPGATAPQFTDQRAGPSIFRISGRDDRQGAVAGAYIARTFADRKVAILHDRTRYGRGLADQAKQAMTTAGLNEVMYEAFAAGGLDYAPLVAKLKAKQIAVVFIGGYHTEVGLIAREMLRQQLSAQLFSGDALATDDYWGLAGDAAEGTLMTFWPDPSTDPMAANVVAKLKARGIAPTRHALFSYAAVQAWAQASNAAQTTGSTAAKTVVKALTTRSFRTVAGTFRFDAKGDSTLPPFKIYRWARGSYHQVN